MSSTFAFRECFAEFMGLLTLVFLGGWASVLAANQVINLEEVAIVHGLTIGIFMWCGAAYSKCHFNPAISIAFFAVKKINSIKLIFYVVSQFLGSYMGGLLVYYTLPNALYTEAFDNYAEIGCPLLHNTYRGFTALFMEVLGAFLVTLVFVCLAEQGKAAYFSLVIGFTTGLFYLTTGEMTGASINPFRYLGPALLIFNIYDSYIYVIVPFLGSLAAIAVHEYIFALSEKEKAQQRKLEQKEKFIKIE